MQHIDEHTLELYVLKAKEIADRIDDIEAHLLECGGCKALVSEMSKFYDDLTVELERMPEAEISQEKALVRRNVHLNPIFERNTPAFRYRPSTPLAKIFYFVRRHPVSVGLGSFALVAAIGWFLNDASRLFKSKDEITDINPVKPFMNSVNGCLEIINRKNQKLWEIESGRVIDFSREANHRELEAAVVTDLNEDGKNEVLTVIPPKGNEKKERNCLYIYSSDHKLLYKKSFGRSINYRNGSYQNDYQCDGLLVFDRESGMKDIYIVTKNIRSPSVITRLDKAGNVIGEYWHFGWINDIYAIDVTGDGRKELVICGFNDVAETNHQEFPVIIALDPEKFIGARESGCTPGFGLQRSEAEYFYIRIPRSDMDDLLFLTSGMRGISASDSTLLRFTAISTITDIGSFDFDYLFTYKLEPIQVKSNNKTDQIHYNYVNQGKLTGSIDQTYLDNLKSKISYWDGKMWRKERTMVKSIHAEGHRPKFKTPDL